MIPSESAGPRIEKWSTRSGERRGGRSNSPNASLRAVVDSIPRVVAIEVPKAGGPTNCRGGRRGCPLSLLFFSEPLFLFVYFFCPFLTLRHIAISDCSAKREYVKTCTLHMQEDCSFLPRDGGKQRKRETRRILVSHDAFYTCINRTGHTSPGDEERGPRTHPRKRPCAMLR